MHNISIIYFRIYSSATELNNIIQDTFQEWQNFRERSQTAVGGAKSLQILIAVMHKFHASPESFFCKAIHEQGRGQSL